MLSRSQVNRKKKLLSQPNSRNQSQLNNLSQRSRNLQLRRKTNLRHLKCPKKNQ
jgi:hypothetical protein